MNKVYVLLVLLVGFKVTHGQYLRYTFSASQGVYTQLTGGTPVTTLLSATDFLGDSKTSVQIPIGFPFMFDGVNYSTVVAASDGFISFNPLATTTLTNNLTSTQVTRRALLAPLWDDLSGASGSAAASYLTTGQTGSRVFTIEWLNWQWNYTATGAVISFQVKLYEAGNRIEFIYRREAGEVAATSASIGIAGAQPGVGNFLSLNGSGATPTASISSETATISTKPQTGQVYAFAPSATCNGVPAPGVTTLNSEVSCVASTAILDVAGASIAANLAFQWQSSGDGQQWADIPGAVTPFYIIASVTGTAYYRRKTSCSSNEVISYPIQLAATGTPSNDDYCNATAVSIAGGRLCSNTTCATSINDPVFSKSTPNNTLWYTYKPLVTGAATIVMSAPDGYTSGLLDGWLGIYTASGSCPSPVFTEVVSSLPFNLRTSNSVTLVTPILTKDSTYYFMIDGSAGAYGAFCMQVVATVLAPTCTSVVHPANDSVVANNFVTLRWRAVQNASAYDVYISEGNNLSFTLKASVSAADTSYLFAGLNAATKYFWYVQPKNGGGVATGCQSSPAHFSTSAAPPCPALYLSPSSAATNVPVNAGVVFEWSPSPGATAYDHYVGTTNPPVTLAKTTSVAKDTLSLLLYNTKYYWYVRPKNAFAGGVCIVDSFTTASPLNSCTPLYSAGVAFGDSLAVFRLRGESGTRLLSVPSTTANNSYSDFYNTSNVVLGTGNSYVGFARTGATSNRITIWIDFNDNGFFDANERLLNNQDISSSQAGTYFSVYVPLDAAAGEHRMRVRDVYNQVLPVDACNSYQYGEAEDYKVTIQPTYNPRNISPGILNSCYTLAATTIDLFSNNNTVMVPLLDTAGNVVMAINASGNTPGKITGASLFVNGTGIRTSSNGVKYLDRNYTITTSSTLITTLVKMRFFFTESDLLALQAANPVVNGRSSISMSKTGIVCNVGAPAPTFTVFYTQIGNGAYNGGHFVDFESASYIDFYLHGATSTLPVTTLRLTGTQQSNRNVLQWSTLSEVNNRGFEIQRADSSGRFVSVQFLASKSSNGNSNEALSYSFDEPAVTGSAWYRIRQIDRDGRETYSNIVVINNGRPGVGGIVSVYPNPASTTLMINLGRYTNKPVKLSVFDVAGRQVVPGSRWTTSVESQVIYPVHQLAPGAYLLKVEEIETGKTNIQKFIKQ